LSGGFSVSPCTSKFGLASTIAISISAAYIAGYQTDVSRRGGIGGKDAEEVDEANAPEICSPANLAAQTVAKQLIAAASLSVIGSFRFGCLVCGSDCLCADKREREREREFSSGPRDECLPNV